MRGKFTKDYWIIKLSGLFDPVYYLKQYPDVRKADVDPLEHFVMHGWKEGRNPNEWFDTKKYMEENHSLTQVDKNPFVDWILRNKIKTPLSDLKLILKIIKANPIYIKKFVTFAKSKGINFAISKAFEKLKQYKSIEHYRKTYNNFMDKDNLEIDNEVKIFYVIQAPDLVASNIYRVFNFIEVLQQCNIKTDFCFDFEIPDKINYILSEFNMIVFYRCGYNDYIQTLIQEAKKINLVTFFDTDDYIFDPDIASIEYIDGLRFLQPKEMALCIEGFYKYQQTLFLCDFATVSTNYLKKTIENKYKKPAFVLKNFLNRRYIETCKELLHDEVSEDTCKKQVVIGYFAGTKTHQRDFKVVSKVLAKLLAKYSFVELLISDKLDLSEFPELQIYNDRIKVFSTVDYYDLPYIIKQADISIAPLEFNNPFCQAKSEVKFIESAALKKPVVCSPTEIFVNVIKDGENGFIAENEEEWYKKLQILITNERIRKLIGNKAYEFVLSEYFHKIPESVIHTYKLILELYKQKGVPVVVKERPKISILIPEYFAGSGGHTRIFELANYLSKDYEVKIYVNTVEINLQRDLITDIFYKMFGSCRVEILKYEKKSFDKCDIAIATHWSTVYLAIDSKDKFLKLLYFVQDYEPYFNPMSWECIQSDLSYKYPDIIVCFNKWVFRKLKEKHPDLLLDKNKTIIILPFYIPDYNIINPAQGNKIDSCKINNRIIFLARPDMPRRLYNYGIEVLNEVYKRMNGDVDIILFGSDKINSTAIPFKHKNLSVLKPHELVELYNTASIGIVFNTTNPSIVPYEMMMCKCAVVDIDYGLNYINYPDKSAILVPPNKEIAADKIILLLKDKKKREEVIMNAYNYVSKFPRKDQVFNSVKRLINTSLEV